MLQATYKNSYRNQAGNKVFAYVVNSNDPEELEQYKTIQGTHLQKDEQTGLPIFFTTRLLKQRVKLVITSKGRVAVDESAEERRIIEKSDEHLERMVAEHRFKQMFANTNTGSSAASAAARAKEEPKAEPEVDPNALIGGGKPENVVSTLEEDINSAN